MATEYTITYTYSGQNNTSGSRSVPFSKFSASGNTDKTIGQIKSISYEHYHSSTSSMSWGLQGRLIFSDGTTCTSDRVYQSISGNVVKYVNTFSNLPTAEQFAALTSVQTLDTQGKTTSGGYSATLYWRATGDCPMRIIVKFIEEPPVTYAPSIAKFELSRVNASAVRDDEGQYIATTLKLTLGNAAGQTGAQCRIYYAANAYPEVGVSQYVDLSSQISSLMTGVSLNTSLLSGVWGLGYVWHFAVVFTAGDETAIATASVARGSTSLHISGEPGGGAAVGGFSTGTAANPKFEAFVPAHFYDGISGVTNFASSEETTGGKWIDGKRIYRRTFSFASQAIAKGTTTTVLGEIDHFNEIETMLDVRGSIELNGEIYPLGRIYSTSAFSSLFISDVGSIRLCNNLSAACTLNRLVLIIEYTKVN